MNEMDINLSKKRMKLVEKVMSNEDLLLEVLLRLPAKPLIRFKCVSKYWLSIISEPEFRSKHTRMNPTQSTLGIYFDDKYNIGIKSVSLDPNKKDLPALEFIKRASPSFYSDKPAIMHACNGLLLCSYSCKSPYFVCNITTRATTVLPQHVLPSSEWYHDDHSAYLVFDPSKSPHFKVVLLDLTVSKHDTNLHYDEEYKEKNAYCYGLCYEIDVYSSETGVWKRMFFQASHGSHLNYKAYCNGSLHWITMKKYHVRFEVETSRLFFNPMPLEPTTLDMEKIRYFGECDGHLFLVHIPWRSAKPFHVFELDENKSSCKTKYRVNMSLLTHSFLDSFQYMNPSTRHGIPAFSWKFFVVCVVKEDEMNGFALLLVVPGKIISYNLRKNTIKVIQELPMKEFPLINHYCFADTYPFIPTLSPV